MPALFFILGCILFWSLEDICLKLGTSQEEKHLNWRFSSALGMMMLAAMVPLLAIADTGFGAVCAGTPAWQLPWTALRFHVTYVVQLWLDNPVFLLVPLSCTLAMLISNIGLKYLDMSIMSPLENSSGGLPVIILLIYFYLTRNFNGVWDELEITDVIGAAAALAGIAALTVVQIRLARTGRDIGNRQRTSGKYGRWALLFPLVFALCDSVETVVCGIMLHLDEESISTPDMCLLYCSVFAVAGFGSWLILRFLEGRWYHPFTREQLPKAAAGALETIAYCFYIRGMELNPLATAPASSAYCILTVFLSRFILKEKMQFSQYVCLAMIMAGVVCLGLSG